MISAVSLQPKKRERERESRGKNESAASEPSALHEKCFKARPERSINLCNRFQGEWSQCAHLTPDGAASDGFTLAIRLGMTLPVKPKSLRISLSC